MCGSMADIQSAAADIRRGKKEEEEEQRQDEIIMVCAIPYTATIINGDVHSTRSTQHNQVTMICSCKALNQNEHIIQVLDLTPSSRQYLSNHDCLQGARENYQNCSVLCCVRQLGTTICTPI